MNELRIILDHMKQPEYIHVLINPMPLFGTAIGALFLLGGLLRRSVAVQIGALLLLVAVGAGTRFVVRYGQRGYDRVSAMSNEDAQQWLKIHMNRGEKSQYAYYLTALLALAALGAIKKEHKAAKSLALAALVASGVCVGLAGWISHAGGQVRHSEFREGPPPAEWLPKDTHRHDHAH